MWPIIHRRSLVALWFAAAMLVPDAALKGQLLYWDINGPSPGSSGGTTAPGAWGSAANWTTSAAGTTATQTWVNGATARFAAGSNATGSYIVNVQGSRFVAGLHFASGDVTILGQLPNTTSQRLVPSSGALQVFVESGAIGRFSRLPLDNANSPSITKTGGGLFSWELGHAYHLSTARFNGGHTSLGVGTILQPGTLQVGVDTAASLAVAGGFVSSIRMVTSAGVNNVVFGMNAGSSGTATVSDGGGISFASNFLVGQSGNGSLTINSGGDVRGIGSSDCRLILAANPGSTGTVQVNPGGLIWLSGANALSRGVGTAEFRLAGGTFRTARQLTDFSTSMPIILSGTSTITVKDPYSAFFNGPLSGNGSLVILSDDIGSNVVLSGDQPFTGATTVSRGGLALSGSASELGDTASLSVGLAGTGRLTLGNGARVTPTTFISFGNSGQQGTGTLADSGTLLAAGTYLEVGSGGPATLDVTSGAGVSSATTTALGVLPGSAGTVNVSGNGSSLNVGTALLLGYQSTGIFTIANGGSVTIGDVLELGSFPGSSGVMVVDQGGTLRVGGTNAIRTGTGVAGFQLGGGTLEVRQSSLTTSVPITLSNVSTIKADSLNAVLGGTLSGAGGLTKTGTGTLFLNVPNTYAGGTTIAGGRVTVPAGSSLGSGPVTVNNASLHSTATLSRDSSIAASGTNASVSAASFIEVGLSGNGALAVTGGASVSTPGSVAFGLGGPGAVGQADVSGAGSTLSAGTIMYAGFLGTGGITVGSGATVTAGEQLLLAAGSGSTGTFNLNTGGTLNVGGVNGIAKGTGTATFNWAGGLLKVTGSSLSTSLPMNLTGSSSVDTSGVDASLNGPLAGPGSLSKIGAGTLTLGGSNSVTGGFTHWAGTVKAATASSLPSGPLALNGGTLDLDFAGTSTVQSLGFDGAVQSGGVWGGLASSAPNKTARITGPGLLNVLSSVLPPSFNSETSAGLQRPLGAGTLDLATATAVTPGGGTFSGPGVSGGTFDPGAAGFGLHTITYTVGGQSATFTIAVTGGLVLEQQGGTFAPGNLAPTGTAFAKDVLNHPSHSIPALNDGQYGNSSSWIGDSAGSHAGIAFAAPVTVNRIAFGRDNTGNFADRAASFYAVQFTTDPAPASPGATWTTLGAVEYRNNATPGVTVPAARHLFRFAPVSVTGLRIVPALAGAAIDEIEIYPASGLFRIGDLTLLQEGGAVGAGNLALAGTAFSQNEIGVAPHTTAGVNDGIAGNQSSWIGATVASFVGVNLGGTHTINRIAFGRDNTGAATDRTLGRYTLQYTTVPNPGASTPDGSWITLGTADYLSASGPMFAQPSRRHLFGFPTVNATGVRILTDAAGAVAIDELEVYLGSGGLSLRREGGVVVPDNGSVDFGSTFPSTPVARTFTILNTGTDTLEVGSFNIPSPGSADFAVTPPETLQLAPGQSTTFHVTFTPALAGPRTATLQFTSNDPAAPVRNVILNGTGSVPSFNSATTTGLSFSLGSGPVDLATATGAQPAGGVFTGPGVTGGQFNPAAVGYGQHSINYAAAGASSNFVVSVTGGLTLQETGGTFAPGNLAPTGTAFAKDEIGVFPHAIPDLNDATYGNSSSWIGAGPESHAGVSFGAQPVFVDRIAFGRDNTGTFLDRGRGTYTVQYTTDPVPALAPADSWVSLGAVDTRALTNPHLRRVYSFPAVAATGIRLIVQSATDYIAIDEIELYGPGGTPAAVDVWRQRYFGTAANAGPGADLNDFDKDGVVNFAEFGFGLDPTLPSRAPLPQYAPGEAFFAFNTPEGVSGITYRAEWSPDLVQWFPITNTGVAPANRFSVPTAGKPRLFLRFRVVAP